MVYFVNRIFFSNHIITNLSGVLCTLSDNIKKSAKNCCPDSWTTKSENLWSVQTPICCQHFKEVLSAMQTGTSACSRIQRSFSVRLRSPVVSAQCNETHSACTGRSELAAFRHFPMLLLGNCCCKVLLMPGAAGCCKGRKLLGSLVQQFPYRKQRTTDQRIARACLSVPVNMKIWCALPTAKWGKVLASYTESPSFLQHNLLCYFI